MKIVVGRYCLVMALVLVLAPGTLSAQIVTFLRGDCDGDGEVAGTVSDAVSLLEFNFAGAAAPPCLAACDVNDDGQVRGDVADAVYLLQFLFLGGAAVPEPFPACGVDPTPDTLLCAVSSCGGIGDGLPAIFSHFTENVVVELDGSELVLRTDDVPNHPSPYFSSSDPRYEVPHDGMRVNPHNIAEQDIVLRVPLEPQAASAPSDTRLGPIGVAVNGVVLFNQYAAGFSPLDAEIMSFDAYNGHPAPGDLYHYHIEPLYITAGDRGTLVGVMLDGYPLYGPVDPDGSSPTDLDDCNGHFGPTPDHPEGTYHYHVTGVPPYFVGCYRGTPGSVTR